MTSRRAPKVVLDASAIAAWLLREPGFQTVDRLMEVAVAPASALTEALYVAVQRGHAMVTAELQQHLLSYGLRVEPVDERDCVRAAELILTSRTTPPDDGSLSLGDGLCIAVAERLGLVITGGDRYWESIDIAVPYHPFR